jgi:hypothetical protein
LKDTLKKRFRLVQLFFKIIGMFIQRMKLNAADQRNLNLISIVYSTCGYIKTILLASRRFLKTDHDILAPVKQTKVKKPNKIEKIKNSIKKLINIKVELKLTILNNKMVKILLTKMRNLNVKQMKLKQWPQLI